jgi:hypothetical protein
MFYMMVVAITYGLIICPPMAAWISFYSQGERAVICLHQLQIPYQGWL